MIPELLKTVEKNHGRFERRTCVQTDFVEWFAELDEWYGLMSVVMVEKERIVGGVSSVERSDEELGKAVFGKVVD